MSQVLIMYKSLCKELVLEGRIKAGVCGGEGVDLVFQSLGSEYYRRLEWKHLSDEERRSRGLHGMLIFSNIPLGHSVV